MALCFVSLVAPFSVAAEGLPAFPGAEGFGAVASGGRGGRIIAVTNLNASGPGSLADAVCQFGPRIVVFRVSGEIKGDLFICEGNLTIAGQTAPGAGITIRGRLYSHNRQGIDNIIIRYLRVRPLAYDPSMGPGDQYDAMQFSKNRLLILDHISVSWGVDETIDIYSARNVTIQWSSIEESATKGHYEGRHNYGLISGPKGNHVSIHHNLFAHHSHRSPAIASGPAEVINNLVYDVKDGFHHHNPARGKFNIIGNYYRRGPSSRLIPFSLDYEGTPGPGLSYFFKDNFIDDPGDLYGVVNDPWRSVKQHSSFRKNVRDEFLKSDKPFNFSRNFPVTIQQSKDVPGSVLSRAGAFPRDVVTLRMINEVIHRTGAWGMKEPADIMANLMPASPPKDSDHDGMPDFWEKAHGLNPNNDIDSNKPMLPDGYTAIEMYINELADNLTRAAKIGIKLADLPEISEDTSDGQAGIVNKFTKPSKFPVPRTMAWFLILAVLGLVVYLWRGTRR